MWPWEAGPNGADYGIGPTCLAGLAQLEAGRPVTDPAVKNITNLVREAAYSQNKTYQVSLCLMFLDRLGDPADVPLIQALAVRLLAGQNAAGGWGYEACAAPLAGDIQRLKAVKADQPAGKLHPEIERYAQAVFAVRGQGGGTGVIGGSDDNSNSQFAILAVWLRASTAYRSTQRSIESNSVISPARTRAPGDGATAGVRRAMQLHPCTAPA